IINLEDLDTKKLFTESERNKLPRVNEWFAKSLIRFSNVKTTKELKNVLETTYKNNNKPYNRNKHYNSEWAKLVMQKL
ncbi:17739_t:CDS:2, partial [Dentiscutata erythropus]